MLYFKKCIVITKKVPIVPLNASPNTLLHLLHSLILDIDFNIFAGLTKYRAKHILLLEHLCWLAITCGYKIRR